MSTLNKAGAKRVQLGGLRAGTDGRLSLGQSAAVIAGLSVLSWWAVLVSIILVLRAIL